MLRLDQAQVIAQTARDGILQEESDSGSRGLLGPRFPGKDSDVVWPARLGWWFPSARLIGLGVVIEYEEE
jgi:hypothetical protein